MLEVQRPAMATTSYSTNNSRARLNRHVSIDSSQSRLTVSSIASTRVEPRSSTSIADIDTETETESTIESLVDSEDPNTPSDDARLADQDIPHFYVLCLYDFDSEDPDHIQFQRNDILKIIHEEPSGWWAAQDGDRVGWVPSSFVAVIPFEMVDALYNVRHDLRVYEYEAEALYNAAPTSNLPLSGTPPSDQDSSEHHEQVNLIASSSRLHSPRDFPTDVTPAVARFDIPKNLPSLQSPVPGVLVDPWHIQHQTANFTVPVTPRTPRTPIPPKVPAPEPWASRSRAEPPPLRVNTTTSLRLNKPTPPTPDSNTPASDNTIFNTPVSNISLSPPSKASGFSPATVLPRSRSLGSFSASNAGRRRKPDGLNLSPVSRKLWPLAEASNSTSESVEELGSTSSLDNPPPRSNMIWRPGKVWRLTGEDGAQAFQNAQIAQASQPSYLRPQHAGNEIKLDYDGSVKAGTLEALVERLTIEPLILEQELTFRHTFLLTFRTFSTADRILELLIERYELESPEGLAHEQFMEWKEKKLRPTQARVLHVFTLWVENYGLVEDDPQVISRLRDFLDLVRSPAALAASARHIMSALDRPRQSDTSVSPLSVSVPTRRNTRKYRNDLLKIDPAELARQLTLYEARLYVKIRPHECLTWAGTQKGESVQNLRSFVSTSDKVAAWVKLSVLNNDALGKRADTIELWIKVADKCRALNNYSSMSAIVAALTSSVIARLQLTWAHVNKASHVEPLVKLSEPTNNFATYRQLFSSTEGPCLPYIGIFLSDMVKVTETAPNTVKVPETELALINFTKRQKMAEVARTILRHQPKVRDQYKISEVTPVMQYVEAQLKLAAGKDEGSFWMRSQDVQTAELAHADIRKGLEAAGF